MCFIVLNYTSTKKGRDGSISANIQIIGVPGEENKSREDIFEEIIKITLEVKKKDERYPFERAPNIPNRINNLKMHTQKYYSEYQKTTKT